MERCYNGFCSTSSSFPSCCWIRASPVRRVRFRSLASDPLSWLSAAAAAPTPLPFFLCIPLPGTCSGACIRKSLTNLLRCTSVSCCNCRCCRRRPTPRALIKIHGRLINRQFTHLIEFPSASYCRLLCCCCCCFYSYFCFLGPPPSAAVVMQFHFWLG